MSRGRVIEYVLVAGLASKADSGEQQTQQESSLGKYVAKVAWLYFLCEARRKLNKYGLLSNSRTTAMAF